MYMFLPFLLAELTRLQTGAGNNWAKGHYTEGSGSSYAEGTLKMNDNLIASDWKPLNSVQMRWAVMLRLSLHHSCLQSRAY